MALAQYVEFDRAISASRGPLELMIVMRYASRADTAHNKSAQHFWGGNHGKQALPDHSCGRCDPLRTRLSGAPGTSIFILQQLRGATLRLISAVLRCGGFGVGADRLVREGFSGLGRGAECFNRER